MFLALTCLKRYFRKSFSKVIRSPDPLSFNSQNPVFLPYLKTSLIQVMTKRNSMAKVIGLKLNWIYNSSPRKWKDLKGVTSIQFLLLFKPILSQSMVNGGLVRQWFLWEKLVRTKFFGLVNFHQLKIVSTSCLSKLKHIRVKVISNLRKYRVYFALEPCKKLGTTFNLILTP